MIKKIHNFKLKIRNYNAGMTYVELIVVLSIFGIMSSIILFNYGKFQAKVDIKNLASDIALKIVQAQKDAMSGKIQINPFTTAPAYGVYFDLLVPDGFIYFADLDNSNDIGISELLEKINITKGNYIFEIGTYTGTTLVQQIATPLSITFTRPNSSAIFNYLGSDTPYDYIQITISSSDDSVKGYIKIYPSGRIQVN